jgi:hypothetical protein
MKRCIFFSIPTFVVLIFISSSALTVAAGPKALMSKNPGQQEQELYDEDYSASAIKKLGATPLQTAYYKCKIRRRGDIVKSRATTKTDVIVDYLHVKNKLCRNGVCSKWSRRYAYAWYKVKAGWNADSPSAANWVTKSRHRVEYFSQVYTKRLRVKKYM